MSVVFEQLDFISGATHSQSASNLRQEPSLNVSKCYKQVQVWLWYADPHLLNNAQPLQIHVLFVICLVKHALHEVAFILNSSQNSVRIYR